MSNYTHQQLTRISELDAEIDAAADKGDDAFFTAVAAKDEYIDSQGIDRDRLEVTGRETQGNVEFSKGESSLDLWTDVPHGVVPERGSVEVGTDRGRDYQYKVLVNNAEFMKGDAGSVGILFGNLSGKNFTQRPGHDQTHAEWLAYMSSEYSAELHIGAHIQLCNPDGAVLLESEIGEELPAQRPRSDSMSRGM